MQNIPSNHETDINFELYFEGHKLSKDKPISVEWMSSSQPPETTAVEDATLSGPAVSRSRGLGNKNIAISSVAMLSNISIAKPSMPNIRRRPVAVAWNNLVGCDMHVLFSYLRNIISFLVDRSSPLVDLQCKLRNCWLPSPKYLHQSVNTNHTYHA